MKSEEGATELVVFENQGYDNLKHRRAVFYVNKKFFVLVDEGIGNAEGTIDVYKRQDMHLRFISIMRMTRTVSPTTSPVL